LTDLAVLYRVDIPKLYHVVPVQFQCQFAVVHKAQSSTPLAGERQIPHTPAGLKPPRATTDMADSRQRRQTPSQPPPWRAVDPSKARRVNRKKEGGRRGAGSCQTGRDRPAFSRRLRPALCDAPGAQPFFICLPARITSSTSSSCAEMMAAESSIWCFTR